MIRLLKLLGNIVDPRWWADLIGEKSGAYERARKPNKFKEWKLKQPLWKQFFIEVIYQLFHLTTYFTFSLFKE